METPSLGIRGFTSLAVLVAGVSFVSAARASGPLGPNGSRLQTSDYNLDLYSGLVWAGARMTGLAGSMVAIAEDVDSNLLNPATPAVRPYYSVDDFDYWLGLGLTLPGTLTNVDFFNTWGKSAAPKGAPEAALFLVPAANVQFGHLGIGVTIEGQNYGLRPETSTSATNGGDTAGGVTVTTTTTHVQVAYAFLENELVIGAGARISTYAVSSRQTSFEATNLLTAAGTGVEAGAVWKPALKQFRIGASVRSGISTRASYTDLLLPTPEGDLVVDTGSQSYYLPRGTIVPWDVAIGVAYEVGPRLLNPPWRSIGERVERETLEHRLRQLERARRVEAARATGDPKALAATEATVQREQKADDRELQKTKEDASWAIKERQAKAARAGVLVSLSLILTGGATDAVGIESLLLQSVNRSGTDVVLSPRIGLESEVWPQTLKLRGGTYLEPTRVETSLPRVHYTFGADVPIGRWDVLGLWPSDYLWRLSATTDVAERFYSFSFSIGGWYPRHYREVKRP